jgi:serine-type D-Ala-D-Ala carboxypeptidase (penicillin-binding protein 5/6)
MEKFSIHSRTCRIFAGALLLISLAAGPLDAAPKKKTASKKPKTTKPAPAKVVQKKPEPPPPPPLAPGELPLAARAALALDIKEGTVLYEKNADAREYPASATKILTALLVLEAGDLDRLVTVELDDTKVEPSALYIKPGETYPRKHLLYALLLKSANDVAMALARDHSGSVAAFAERMTKRAAELGAKDTRFTNPHGLHHAQHYTTARDLSLIARAAMQNPLFREIVATPDAMMPKGEELVKLKNHNKLLGMLDGCNGVKTGYTVPAQQVLVSSAMREGREVLSVVLHTNKPGIWVDSKMMLLDGLKKLGLALAPAELALLPPPVDPNAVPPPAEGAPGIQPGKPAPGAAAPAPAAALTPGAKPVAVEPTTTLVPVK